MEKIDGIEKRNVFIVGAGASGKTTLAFMLSAKYGHERTWVAPLASKSVLAIKRKDLNAPDRERPYVVDGLQDFSAFKRLFNPAQDILVVLQVPDAHVFWPGLSAQVEAMSSYAAAQIDAGIMPSNHYSGWVGVTPGSEVFRNAQKHLGLLEIGEG